MSITPIPKRTAGSMRMTIRLSHVLLAVDRELWEKQYVGSLFSNNAWHASFSKSPFHGYFFSFASQCNPTCVRLFLKCVRNYLTYMLDCIVMRMRKVNCNFLLADSLRAPFSWLEDQYICTIVLQLVSSHSFPLPRLKMMERRFRARKAFCGSQVRNISCTMADIWKASKYRRLDL